MPKKSQAEKSSLRATGRRRIVADYEEPGVIIIKHKERGKLHDLLLQACPPDSENRKSITVLANRLAMSPWGVHKWINKGKIPPGRALQVVEISDGRATLADFSPFIYV